MFKYVKTILWALGALMAYWQLSSFTVLSADANRQSRGGPGINLRYPVVASDIIYKGALVSINAAGYAIPASDTAATFCVGVADEKVDNSSGSAGDKWVRVLSGRAFRITASSITQAMVGESMCVVDDNTVDDAADTTNDVIVGRLVEFISTTEGWVYIPEGGYNI